MSDGCTDAWRRDALLIDRLSAAVRAMTLVRGGTPYYRTAGGVPQEMPIRVERVVRRALKALEDRDGA